MINNFSTKTAKDIYDGVDSRYSRRIDRNLHSKIRRLFDQLEVVRHVEELKVPPSNNLEKLSGKLKNYWSLRINLQFRVIFKWQDGIAYDVDVLDYH